jgi:hypothetical protein
VRTDGLVELADVKPDMAGRECAFSPPPLFILCGKGGRRDSQLGNAAGDFIPRGLPPFTFFVKVGTARSAAHSFLAGTSKLAGCPTIPGAITHRRQSWLASPQRRDLFLAVFEEVRRRYGFVGLGYVAIPDHTHPPISSRRKAIRRG